MKNKLTELSNELRAKAIDETLKKVRASESDEIAYHKGISEGITYAVAKLEMLIRSG